MLTDMDMDKLWLIMDENFKSFPGSKFGWIDINGPDHKKTKWKGFLRGLSWASIAYGIESTIDQGNLVPPNPGQFKKLCQNPYPQQPPQPDREAIVENNCSEKQAGFQDWIKECSKTGKWGDPNAARQR